MFDPTTLVGFHTWLSLIAIGAGLPVVAGLLAGRPTPLATGIFLVTAVLTSVTGFLFPFNSVMPSHVVGGLALLILALALLARIAFHLSGRWRAIDAGALVASLYFLVFVGVAQVFSKVPAARALAPTQSEPPFAIAQGLVLALFVALGIAAVRGLRARRVA